MMKIVGIGGGTGLPVLLSGLRRLCRKSGEPMEISAVVAVSDDGGSTGALREVINMPAMGDVRRCLVSLAGENAGLAAVCEHRFSGTCLLDGHALGNLILSALHQMTGDFVEAVRLASALLRTEGFVIPSTAVPVTLCAAYEDGSVVQGETRIPRAHARIRRVWLVPSDPWPAPGVLREIGAADAIVLGPGSLYTSVIPNLLVAGVADAIHRARGVRVYVCNLMTQPGETDGYSAADHLKALSRYLRPGSIDFCVVNTGRIGSSVAALYSQPGAHPVRTDEGEIRRTSVTPIACPLVDGNRASVAHDPEALAGLIVSLARQARRAGEMVSIA